MWWITICFEQLLAVTENIGARYKEATGAKIRGIYFEGPYFTEKYKGAQNPALIWRIQVWKNSGLGKAIMVCWIRLPLLWAWRGRRLCSDHYRRRGDSRPGTLNATLKKLKAVDAGAVSGYCVVWRTVNSVWLVPCMDYLILQQNWFLMVITLIR